jgi:hypothetical protein
VSVTFLDDNLRIAVVAQLVGTHFASAFARAERYSDLRHQMLSWQVTPAMLAEITFLGPEPGDRIYEQIRHAEDIYDSRFDIVSLGDVVHLPNVERITLSTMFARDIDVAPLRKLPRLAHVRIAIPVSNPGVLDELEVRGVAIERFSSP